MHIGKPYISIFCGSRKGNDPELLKLAFEFGVLISFKYSLIYGGTNIGLMNSFAEGVLSNKGEIIGVITEQFKNDGIMHENVSNIIITKDMHERKRKIYEIADIFIVFPGGIGTLDETFEIMTWKHLGLINKPIILFNYNGFFNELFLFMEKINSWGFLDKKIENLMVIKNNFEELKKELNIY